MGLAGAIFLLLVWILTVSFTATSQAEINAACADRGGVQQVIPTTWVSIKGSTTAVCKDGKVVLVK